MFILGGCFGLSTKASFLNLLIFQLDLLGLLAGLKNLGNS